MAAVSVSKKIVSESGAELVVLYRLHNVTTADTFDVGSDFQAVKVATALPAGDLTSVITATPTGTSIALTLASLSAMTVYLLVIGPAASA